jgi:4-alpha-glucanotransferase
VIYTGTHDNDTTLGWFEARDAAGRQSVYEYLGHPQEAMPWPFIRAALSSVCRLAVLPMQDILALGSGHRMNTPGTSGDNWHWRFGWEQVAPDLAERLHGLVRRYGRVRG